MSEVLKNVLNDYQKLTKQYATTFDKRKKYQIVKEMTSLNDILKLVDSPIKYHGINYEDDFTKKQDYKYFSGLFEYLDIACAAYNIENQYDSFYQDNYNYHHVDLIESVKHARKICYSFDEKFGLFFDEMFKNKRVIYRKKEVKPYDNILSTGYTATAASMQKSYIGFICEEKIKDVLTIVHEMMHAYIEKCTKYESLVHDTKHSMSESLSYFIEYYAINYLINNEVSCAEDLYEDSLFLSLDNISSLLTYIKNDPSFKYEFDYAYYYIDYLNGNMYGLMIYEKYRNNKELTKLLINDIITNYYRYSNIDIIKMFKFNENERLKLSTIDLVMRKQFPNK